MRRNNIIIVTNQSVGMIFDVMITEDTIMITTITGGKSVTTNDGIMITIMKIMITLHIEIMLIGNHIGEVVIKMKENLIISDDMTIVDPRINASTKPKGHNNSNMILGKEEVRIRKKLLDHNMDRVNPVDRWYRTTTFVEKMDTMQINVQRRTRGGHQQLTQ